MSPDEGDHGDVLFVLGLAGKLAELKWYQNVRSLLTPSICPLANIIIRMATCTRTYSRRFENRDQDEPSRGRESRYFYLK